MLSTAQASALFTSALHKTPTPPPAKRGHAGTLYSSRSLVVVGSFARSGLSKRHLLAGGGLLSFGLGSLSVGVSKSLAWVEPKVTKELEDIFKQALLAGYNQDEQAALEAWNKAVEIAPGNSTCWSNRGTLKLQMRDYAGAAADLERSIAIETSDGGPADAISLNQLASIKGALGNWSDAKDLYLKAADVDYTGQIEPIARANYALACFQTGDSTEALRTVRLVLARDPNFLDMRAAEAAFLWAEGESVQAEESYSRICPDEPSSGLLSKFSKKSTDSESCPLYKSVKTVENRWPPRAAAAFDAFLNVDRKGSAIDYDGQLKSYSF